MSASIFSASSREPLTIGLKGRSALTQSIPKWGILKLMSPLELVAQPITRDRLKELAEAGFGDMIKAVVDCRRRVMVVGGELHADEEQWLLDDGSMQSDLWGVNLYPTDPTERWIEFDSMINVRPTQGNPSRSVESGETQALLRAIVMELIRP